MKPTRRTLTFEELLGLSPAAVCHKCKKPVGSAHGDECPSAAGPVLDFDTWDPNGRVARSMRLAIDSHPTQLVATFLQAAALAGSAEQELSETRGLLGQILATLSLPQNHQAIREGKGGELLDVILPRWLARQQEIISFFEGPANDQRPQPPPCDTTARPG